MLSLLKNCAVLGVIGMTALLSGYDKMPVLAQNNTMESTRLQRLETVADIWGKLFLFHPNVLVAGNTDWNKVLLSALPQIEKANNTNEFVNALNEFLLKPLNDSSLLVQRAGTTASGTTKGALSSKNLTNSVGYIDATDQKIYTESNFLNEFNSAHKNLGEIENLIVDLRWKTSDIPATGFAQFFRFFTDTTLDGSTRLTRLHEGWSEKNEPNVYRQRWRTLKDKAIFPISRVDVELRRLYPSTSFDRLSAIKVPTIFLVNNTSFLFVADVLNALQAKPSIGVLWQKSGTFLMPKSESVAYPDNIQLYLNTKLLVAPNNALGFRPDLITDQVVNENSMVDMAKQALANKPKNSARFTQPTMVFPSVSLSSSNSITQEERLLGLFKIWSIMRYFFPHFEYADIEWGSVLREWIPKVENAANIRDYYIVLQQLTAKLNDSHIFVNHRSLTSGTSTIPLRMERIENKAIIAEVKPNTPMPFERGDEVLAIDDMPIQEFEAYWKSRISASSERALYRNIYDRSLWGISSTSIKLTVKKRKDGSVQTGSLMRDTERSNWFTSTDASHFKTLAGNLGYINLFTLPDLNELDKALTALKDTDGIVFDLRGYPKFWITRDLMGRLIKESSRSTIFDVPNVQGPNLSERRFERGQSTVQPYLALNYLKPIVVLINQNTQSMPEDFCIYLTNAKRATFVGLGTTGTNGNITFIYLPGGGAMTFTGMRVLFGDGSRFQNIGIKPHVEVSPTIQGIVEGRDEILEKGIETLKSLIKK